MWQNDQQELQSDELWTGPKDYAGRFVFDYVYALKIAINWH
jgi:hypothetical protein